jgi:hypothetical protein
VVAAFSSEANRTNRNRDQARTAQHMQPGLRARIDDWRVARGPDRRTAAPVMPARHAAFTSVTSWRKFRADPTYPAARAARFAEIRAWILRTAW